MKGQGLDTRLLMSQTKNKFLKFKNASDYLLSTFSTDLFLFTGKASKINTEMCNCVYLLLNWQDEDRLLHDDEQLNKKTKLLQENTNNFLDKMLSIPVMISENDLLGLSHKSSN